MTESYGYGSPAAATGATGDQNDPDDSVETVGQDDSDADAVRSGADVEADGPYGLDFEQQATATDTDGVPVGAADADEDARQSGADPDDRSSTDPEDR